MKADANGSTEKGEVPKEGRPSGKRFRPSLSTLEAKDCSVLSGGRKKLA